jgi:release factor glutamine methyltransferase
VAAAPPSIRDALTVAAVRLAEAGVDTPRLDAELLLAHVLRTGRTHLIAHPVRELTEPQREHFLALLGRREAREPLPYLLGRWEFLGMDFEVSPAVLIPRPETETLVETVAQRLPDYGRILDVGTGTGCVAIGLAKLLPGACVIALEASPGAAEVARRNVERLGYSAQVEVMEGTFPEATVSLGTFDAVVSNPPYIPSKEVDRLAPELRCYEPRLALDGGADGLTIIRPLTSVTSSLLSPGGLLAMEVAHGQAEQVADLLRVNGSWTEIEAIPDLAGIERVVLARRTPQH